MRDYTGPRGWVSLCNQLLRRLETEGLIPFQKKEVGVEVNSGYWITLPADYRNKLKIFEPCHSIPQPFEVINGLVKLRSYIAKDPEPSTFVLSEGTTIGVNINDTDGQENEYAGKLLVLTDGTYSGASIILGEHAAASAGVTPLTFLAPRSSVATSTAGYITETFVKLQYMATFTSLTAEGDTLPIDSRYEHVLVNGLSYLASPVDSKERKAYFAEFEYDIDLVKRDVFTPTPEQARPTARPMAAFENCEDIKPSGFVGGEDAWLAN